MNHEDDFVMTHFSSLRINSASAQVQPDLGGKEHKGV
jgi:hypothetical protein